MAVITYKAVCIYKSVRKNDSVNETKEQENRDKYTVLVNDAMKNVLINRHPALHTSKFSIKSAK